MFLYEFDIIGIIYTVISAVLFALLFTATVLFAVRKKSAGKGTVAFRVLDIILFILLGVFLSLFVLCKISNGFFEVYADVDKALVFSFGADFTFKIPFVGSLLSVWNSVLGIILLAAVTIMSVLSFVFSFVFRKRKPKEASAEEDMPDAEEYYSEGVPVEAEPSESETPVVAENADDKDSGSLSAPTAETEENADITDTDTVAEKTEDVADIVEKMQTASEDSDKTESTAPSYAEEIAVKVSEEPETKAHAGYDYLAEKRVPSAKIYSSALQRPGAKKKNGNGIVKQAELLRPINPPPVKVPIHEIIPKKAMNEKERHAGPLPVTRRLVITNRLNVVNIFNDYLKEKDEAERKKLSESIEQIELGEK